MGFYLNPTSRCFEGDVNSSIYIDKSLIIEVLNKTLDKNNEKYICVSRPRRFGKTQVGNMLAAYYSKGADSDFIFSRLGISKTSSYKEHLNKYNVLKIDLNEAYRKIEKDGNIIKYLTSSIKKEFVKDNPSIDYTDINNISDLIMETYAETKTTFVIIIDEYDVLIREKVNEEAFNEYLNLLNALFKGSMISEAISLAYITGILPIVKDRVQSKLNNFRQSTILSPHNLEAFFGFTEEETRNICKEYGLNFDDCKKWYDGYHLKDTDIYNPNAIVETVAEKEFASHWSATGSYESISEYIQMNFEGIKDDVIRMLSGESIDVNILSFQNRLDKINNKDDVFVYLIHIGYLAYDEETKTCHIPNYEVNLEWQNAIAIINDYSVTSKIIAESKSLVASTLALDAAAVSASLDQSHINVTTNRSYNNEDCLASAIYLSYIAALDNYFCFKEIPAGKGVADVIYVPIHGDRPAIIIELKHDKTSSIAMEQIKNKRYFKALENYHGELYLVGINYDEKTKSHSTIIEKYNKE